MTLSGRGLRMCTAVFLAVLLSRSAYGHGQGPLGIESLNWQNESISRVIGGGSPLYTHPHEVDIGGRKCVAGGLLHFDVRDEYAFDIDETVQVQIEFHAGQAVQKMTLTYDRADAAPSFEAFSELRSRQDIEIPGGKAGEESVQSVSLQRARFANLGFSGTDFSLRTEPVMKTDVSGNVTVTQSEIIVCGIRLKRTYSTPAPAAFGSVSIRVLDEKGQPTPARMGLYDKSGRLPLPSEAAVLIRHYNGASRVLSLRTGAMPWPARNRSIFYVNGAYQARLPAGDYELLIAKGPEYRLARKTFAVEAGKVKEVSIPMQRWIKLESQGWYSGDGHIHYARQGAEDDRNLLSMIQAEDLHVGNILQMGNSGNTHYRQYAWQPVANPHEATFVLAPGQEDPRTAQRGHTIQLNLKAPIRDPMHYILYHEVFARARVQGGITGYAHIGYEPPFWGALAGMALDVPFSLVDFVEVLQWGTANPKAWFDFLNLGYKLSPSAGTDYPYLELPGAVRSYVQVRGAFSPKAWFDGLRQGHTFVTNGPMLEFTLNGQGMGAELQVKSGSVLSIEGSARLNPDIDRLDRIELIEQGEVIRTISSHKGSHELRMRYRGPAKEGTWFVLRAYGKQQGERASVVAMSGPIYVHVDGESFWKPAVVPPVVDSLKRAMQTMLEAKRFEIENWDTDDPDARNWAGQKPLLKQRIEQVTTLYDDIVKRAEATKLAELKSEARGAPRDHQSQTFIRGDTRFTGQHFVNTVWSNYKKE